MNGSLITTIAQIEQFLAATPEIEFSGIADDGEVERYGLGQTRDAMFRRDVS